MTTGRINQVPIVVVGNRSLPIKVYVSNKQYKPRHTLLGRLAETNQQHNRKRQVQTLSANQPMNDRLTDHINKNFSVIAPTIAC